jgi:hypothetical protein
VRLSKELPLILSLTVIAGVSSGDTDRQTGSGLIRGGCYSDRSYNGYRSGNNCI